MSNQTSLEATAVLLLCAPEKSLTSSHIIVKMKPTLSIKKKIKWKNSSKSHFTLCLWQWKRYWMLYAVKNFDHLPQQFHYLCLLAFTSESRICLSESCFFLDPFPYSFLCTSSAFVSCLGIWLFFCHCSWGIHVYNRNQVIVHSLLGVWS